MLPAWMAYAIVVGVLMCGAAFALERMVAFGERRVEACGSWQ